MRAFYGLVLPIVFVAIVVRTDASAEINSGANVIEEIVVTARKKEESLQDVPLAVSAFQGDELASAGYSELSQIGKLTPGLYYETFDRTKPQLFIRGIGSRQYDAGSDPSVGVYLDGAYLGRFGALDLNLTDIERVEVLKGPQGTLYGRNTVGGVVSVVTRDAPDTLSGSIAVETGSSAVSGDDFWSIDAAIGGPIADNGSTAGLIFSHRKRDGYQPYQGFSAAGGSEDALAIRGKLYFPITDELNLRLTADYSDFDGPPLVFIANSHLDDGTIQPISGSQLIPTPEEQDPYDPALNVDAFTEKETKGLLARLSWAGDNLEFHSITSYRELETDEFDDLDGSSLDSSRFLAVEDSDQFSQEFRFNYTTDRLDLLVGAYYSKEEVFRVDAIRYGVDDFLAVLFDLFGLPGLNFSQDIEATSYALFGQLDYSISDNTSFVLGLRQSYDEKEGQLTGAGLAAFGLGDYIVNVDDDWDSFDPMVSLRYQLSDDVMTYITWASGYKSGALQYFALLPIAAAVSAEPEESENLEIGFKGTFLDRTLRVNVALFRTEIQDLQALRLEPGSLIPVAVIDNTGDATIDGFEVEGQYIFSESFSVGFNYAYLDATYDSFVTQFGDQKGNTLPRAPEHSWGVSLNTYHEVNRGQLIGRIGYSWRDEVFFEADNGEVNAESGEDSVESLDVSLNYEFENWTIGVYGRNLTDERYVRSAFVTDGSGLAAKQAWSEPRTYGLRVKYDFGER